MTKATKKGAESAPAVEPEATPVQEPEVKKPEATPVQEPEVKKPEGRTLVMVENLKGTFFRQSSTGIRIGAYETKELADDSWLGLQVKAGLLKKV